MIHSTLTPVKYGPFALGAVPLDGSRALVRRLLEAGYIETAPLPSVHTELFNPESGCWVCLSNGGYTPPPAGRLLVAALCCSSAERAELRRLIEVAP